MTSTPSTDPSPATNTTQPQQPDAETLEGVLLEAVGELQIDRGIAAKLLYYASLAGARLSREGEFHTLQSDEARQVAILQAAAFLADDAERGQDEGELLPLSSVTAAFLSQTAENLRLLIGQSTTEPVRATSEEESS